MSAARSMLPLVPRPTADWMIEPELSKFGQFNYGFLEGCPG